MSAFLVYFHVLSKILAWYLNKQNGSGQCQNIMFSNIQNNIKYFINIRVLTCSFSTDEEILYVS